MFKKKTILEKYEEQFKVKEMQNKHIFYDLFARVGDPEELRSFITELLQDYGWKASLNVLTKFEEMDIEGIFRGGRLKPIKSIIKSYKQLKKGPRYPLLWKLFFFIGICFLIFYLYTVAFPTEWNPNFIIKITPIWFILSLLIYSIKETVSMAMWIKIAGVYNIQDEEADVRIVIAADADKKDKEAYNKLEADISEIYGILSKKYVPRKKVTRTMIIRELKPKKKNPAIALLKTIKDIDEQLAVLNKRFIKGEIKEETYKELKEDLEKRRAKADTLLDLISLGE